MTKVNGKCNNTWNVNLNVQSADIKDTVLFRIDTQAQYSIISLDTVKSIGDLRINPTAIKIRALGGSLIHPVGEVRLDCSNYRGVQRNLLFQVLDRNVPNLLGDIDSVNMGLIWRVHSLDECMDGEDWNTQSQNITQNGRQNVNVKTEYTESE